MIEPGTLLQNRYRVTRQIGRGGMGAVYVATDERFNSTVAVKQTFFFEDPALRRAFEREAILLNHLRHAALPRVSDHFVEEEGQFIVMEYIEGADLGELLKARGGWFPVADVLAWADELLDALEYLHTQQPPAAVTTNETEAPERQTDQGAGASTGDASAADNSKQAAPTQNASPIVIVVNPTPAPAADAPAESDDAARRAEDERRRRQVPPPYAAPPPPGHRPPPPPPGAHPHPPLPRRPPPF